MPDSPQIAHPRTDGLYVSPGPEYSGFLRFFSSGQACSVSSVVTGSPAEQVAAVAEWLTLDHDGISTGIYKVQGQKIVMDLHSSSGRISYIGEPTADSSGLRFTGHSYINGHDFEDTYQFESLARADRNIVDLPWFGFEIGEAVKLVIPFTSSDGTKYEAGWTGNIFTFKSSLMQCIANDRYEVGFDADSSGRERGMVILQSAHMERLSDVRREGELRQGDRVRLLVKVSGTTSLHEAGEVGTVLTRRIAPNRISHDVALDFNENVNVPRDQLEQMPDRHARVIFSHDGSVRVDFSDGNAF